MILLGYTVWKYRLGLSGFDWKREKMYRKSLKTSDLDIAKEQARKAGTKIISDVSAGKKINH